MNDMTKMGSVPLSEAPGRGAGQRRVSRRGLLIGLAGVVAGILPVLPRLGRSTGTGPLGMDAVAQRQGSIPTRQDLAQILTDGLDGTLPVYLPDSLPAGWRPAPYVSDASLTGDGRALFLNPAIEPGLFYRVGYTNGDPTRLDQLVTVTVRMPHNFNPGPGDADEKAPAESVTGRYLTVRGPTHEAADIVIQGPTGLSAAVRAIAASVSPA